MDKKLITQQTYDQSAQMMAEEFNSWGARVEDIDRAFFFAGKFNPFVLEIGCGNGRDAKEILERTNAYIGIDSSFSMIELAKKTAPHGRFILIDIEDFEFLFSQEVDIILSFTSLSHVDKNGLKTIFDRAWEKMSKGGIFYLSLKYGQYDEILKEDEYGKRVFYYYKPEIIRKIAGERFDVVYESVYDTKNHQWFTIILKK